MPQEKIAKLVELHEGRVPHAYQDSLGYWTIGVGHLVDKSKGGSLPPEIVDALLAYDIKKYTEKLRRHAPWTDNLDEVRRAVLVDMTFNLGSLVGWPKFMGQVKDGDYAAAAANMRATKWATQVKTRATRLANMMETGKWPAEIA